MMQDLMEAISQSAAAEHARGASAVAAKLARSVGKAAWIVETTFLVLGVPLIFVVEREMAVEQMEHDQQAEMHAILDTTTST